jgi:hypothetical protein
MFRVFAFETGCGTRLVRKKSPKVLNPGNAVCMVTLCKVFDDLVPTAEDIST